MLLKIAQEIESLLVQVKAECLWSGFKFYPYAIYDASNYYLVTQSSMPQLNPITPTIYRGKRDERFLGNTAIAYDSGLIAIWDTNSSGMIKKEQLTAMMIHEMFHAFQQEKGEGRFPNELLGISYPLTVENVMLRHTERKQLLKACTAENKTLQLKRLAQFFQIRAQRQQHLGEHLDYEKAVESVEGTAVYVEFQALQKLTKGETSLEKFIEGYLTLSRDQLKIRLSSYNQGLLLSLIADHLLGEWQVDFMESQDYLSDFILKSLGNRLNTAEVASVDPFTGYDTTEKSLVNNCLHEWEAERDEVFDQFECNKKGQTILGPITVTGIDPMNITLNGQMVIHQHFLRIKQGEEEQVLDGPVKTEIGSHLFDVQRIEW